MSEPAAPSLVRLLSTRRFLPLFLVQLLGALNDNLFKNALVVLLVYRLAAETGVNGQVMATLAAALFILPYCLFSGAAGRFADQIEKGRLIRLIKLAEIAIMILASSGFALGSLGLLLVALFLMGMHSTFFGPIKYGILPMHLSPRELLGGNALIEAGTFLAILVGTILGGVLILGQHGVAIVSALSIGVAAIGFAISFAIPPAPPVETDGPLSFNPFAGAIETLAYAHRHREIFRLIMANSWFWLVGATYLSQFPAFAKDIIGADEHVVTLMLTGFSLGIGIGSLLCNRLLRGEVSARYIWLAALGMAIFTIDLTLAARGFAPTPGHLATVTAFVSSFAGVRVVIDLVLIAACGGLFIVPLYAVLQARSDPAHRSRVIAANNIWNAVFMVGAAIGTVLLFEGGFSVADVFLAVGLGNLGVAFAVRRLLTS